LASLFGLGDIPAEPEDRVALASVNPSVAEAVLGWAKRSFRTEPLVAEANLPVRIPDAVAERRRVGVDRLLNGLAAYYRARSACLAVDAGTAITIDAVSAEGVFLGGIIAPGLRMSARALAEGTAFLPEVDLAFPADVLGRDTVSAIQSGLLWGVTEMVAGLVARLTVRIGGSPRVFLTGGDAPLLSGHLPAAVEAVPYLALDGLRLAVEGYGTQGG
jgi:type III pantothenate kinase